MIKARIAEEKDSKTVYEWRNDATTREMSITTETIDWEGHKNWYEHSLANPSRLLLICTMEETDKSVAVVRFDVDRKKALVSINLSPEMRGKGLAKKCLEASIGLFSTKFTDVALLEAEIKQENRASLSLFKGIGFVPVKEENNLAHYEYFIR